MMKYMLTLKNGFNGGCEYYKTHTEAAQAAMTKHSVGYIPEAIYAYDESTKRYDRLIGKFSINKRNC